MLPNFRALHWELSGGHEHGVQEPHSLAMELSKPLPPPGCPGPRSRGCYWGSNWFIILLAEIKAKELGVLCIMILIFSSFIFKSNAFKVHQPRGNWISFEKSEEVFQGTWFSTETAIPPWGKNKTKTRRSLGLDLPGWWVTKGTPLKYLMFQYPLCTDDLYKSQNDTLKVTERLKEFLRVSDERCTRIAKLSY